MDESGQAMTEYGLIIALVALVVIAALTYVSGGLTGLFNKVGTALNTAN